MGEQTDITVKVTQEGIKNEVTIFLVTSEERRGEWEQKLEIEEAKLDEGSEEIFSLRDPVTMVEIKRPVIGSKCHHVQPFDLMSYLSS